MTLPNNASGNTGEFRIEDAGRALVFLVIAAVAIGIGVNDGCKRAGPNARWNRPDPLGRDLKAEAADGLREEAERREAIDRFTNLLNEKERQVRTFDTDDTYRDAVAVATALSRDYTLEANRLGLLQQLRTVQQAAVRAACNTAKAKAVRLTAADRHAAVVEVIEELIADVGLPAKECGQYQDIEQLYQAYLFVRDVAKAAESGAK